LISGAVILTIIISVVMIAMIRRKRRAQRRLFPNQNQLQSNFVAIPAQVMPQPNTNPNGMRNCQIYFYGQN